MEPYDSIGRLNAKAASEARESSKYDAEHAFDTALRHTLKGLKGRGKKAATFALYRLESRFKIEMGLDE